MSKIHIKLLLAVLLACSVSAEPCIVELVDEGRGIHIAVESCGDIGTFSIGGLYEGGWEKLTYNYPKPWKGSFISVKIDDLVYSNSVDSQDKVFMDPYLEAGPRITGDEITTSWNLPGGMYVEQRLKAIENGVLLNITIINKGEICVDSAARIHIDTMLGENDGAPIYIPGDGLKAYEAEYYGKGLDFKYWKAYNKEDSPSVISTGMLAEQRYPDRVVVSNWKKSIYSSWDYEIDPGVGILGDSAVILYYELGELKVGESKSAATSYVNGEPILPTSKGHFGIAEIVTDNIKAVYCTDSEAEIKVDVISRKEQGEGQVLLEIRDERNNLAYSQRRYTGVIGADSVKDISFKWKTPANISPTYFDISAVLYDGSGKEIDRRSSQALVDYTICSGGPAGGLNWMILMIPATLAVFAVFAFFGLNHYSNRGDVELVKEKEGEHVRVVAYNKKKQAIENCVMIDRLTEGAEVDVITSGVKRKDTELIWGIGALGSGEKAILEYRIKDVEFLPPAIMRWDFGEVVST